MKTPLNLTDETFANLTNDTFTNLTGETELRSSLDAEELKPYSKEVSIRIGNGKRERDEKRKSVVGEVSFVLAVWVWSSKEQEPD